MRAYGPSGDGGESVGAKDSGRRSTACSRDAPWPAERTPRVPGRNARAGTGSRSPRADSPCGLPPTSKFASCGVNPMIWTPAPRATSMASIDVLVDPVRPGLDEQQLGRALIVDRVDLGVQLVLGDRLPVDGVAAVIGQLEHDLAGRRLGRLRSSSGGGTCTSIAIRESGCVIMKMISSTSSTSIIGVTLMSDVTPRWSLRRSSPCYFFSFLSSSAEQPRRCFGSVMAAMTRTPARRAVSTASWILRVLAAPCRP